MKRILIISIILIANFSSSAQSYPQLRLRFGAAKSIVSAARSDHDTYFSMYDRPSPLPSGIGLEFSKPLKKPATSLLLGAFLDIQTYRLGIYPKNFIVVPGVGIISSDNGCIRFYAGLEKRIGTKNITPSKNYFSVFGGLGISYNFPGADPDQWTGGEMSDGLTSAGKYFQGIYEQDLVYVPGYKLKIRSHSAHTFTPDIFGGIRWNIRNKKGNTALAVELVCNYGLMTKFYNDIPFTLDGQPAGERLKDKGVNMQINVLIPLKNFGKKKNSNGKKI